MTIEVIAVRTPQRRKKTITSNVQKCAGDDGWGSRWRTQRCEKVYGILLIAAVVIILLLTFQDAAGTVKLSEGLRLWLERFGLKNDFHSFRSDAHLVLYFLFGIVLCLYGRECSWSWWVILLVGCGVGLIDESIKVLLPTREFDFVDLVKDWVGMAAAMLVIWLIKRRTINE